MRRGHRANGDCRVSVSPTAPAKVSRTYPVNPTARATSQVTAPKLLMRLLQRLRGPGTDGPRLAVIANQQRRQVVRAQPLRSGLRPKQEGRLRGHLGLLATTSHHRHRPEAAVRGCAAPRVEQMMPHVRSLLPLAAGPP